MSVAARASCGRARWPPEIPTQGSNNGLIVGVVDWRNPVRDDEPRWLRLDQSESRFGIDVFLERRGALGQHHLARGADVRLKEVPAMGRAVLLADDRMRMNDGLSVLQRHVPNERQELQLLIQRDRWFIRLRVPTKPAQTH